MNKLILTLLAAGVGYMPIDFGSIIIDKDPWLGSARWSAYLASTYNITNYS